MEDYPITLLEFEKRFATEEACRQYFFKLRWPEGFRCPSCDSQKAWLTERSLCSNGSMRSGILQTRSMVQMPWACSEFSVLAVTGHLGHVFTNCGELWFALVVTVSVVSLK